MNRLDGDRVIEPPPTEADDPDNGHLGDPRWQRAPSGPLDRGPRLLERSEVLSEIGFVLRRTYEHPTYPIVIEGLTGTGKTALLNTSLRIGRELGLGVRRARCDAAESGSPFGVVRQVFSSMLHQLVIPDESSNDGTELGRRVLRDGASSTDDPVDIYQSLMALLDQIAGGPTMIGVDDVEWADPMSAGWLQYLSRRLNAASVYLVMTTCARRARPACATDSLVFDPGTRRFILHPLGIESTMALMNVHLETDVGQSVAAAAHRVTGGNPLLIARMLAALDELEAAAPTVTENQIETLTSPVVAHSVLARASILPDGALGLLEALAVLGSVELRTVAAVAGLEGDVAGRLADALADAGILGWGRPLDFAHPLERCSVYAEIPLARRARAHAHAARVLAMLGHDLVEVATHLMQTDPSGDEWTASTLIEAARRQLESGDIGRADQLLDRADREAPGNQLSCEVARIRAHVDGRRGCKSAVEHLRRSARLGLDPVSLAETALDLLDHQQDRSTSNVLLEMARSVGDRLAEHPATAVRLQLAERVLVREHGGLQRIDDSAAAHDIAYASSVTARLVTAQQAVDAAARLDITHNQLIDTLRPLLTRELLGRGGLVPTAIVSASLGALVRVGAYEIADPLIRSAMAEAETGGREIDAIAYALILAESLAMQGHIVAAEQLLTDARYEADGDLGRCVAMERQWFAALREWRDLEPVELRVIPTLSTDGLAALGASPAMFLAENTARVKLLEGDWASALTNFDRLGSAAEQFSVRNPSFAPWRAGRSAALAGLGRHREGADVAHENLELARQFGSPIAVAEALACAARFRPPETQVVLLKEAVELISGTGAELLRCSLLIDLGFARHHAGDEAAARTAFRDGADQATRLGVTRLAGVASRGLLSCGARPRRLQMSGLQSLTPAELRVARLAAEEHTNGSIAESLFINLKTVESHLTRVYKKLGISDRAELKSALDPNEILFEAPMAD